MTDSRTTSPSGSSERERELLRTAQNGDGDAFGRLVGPYQRELQAHCYRMLGSYADAEDALQETLLRAWRSLARFEGRSSFRSWLYRIATNACLRAIERRPKRVLPMDYAPAADPHGARGGPVNDPVWLEPYPDASLGLEGLAGPDARYEQREGIELAFIAALQHLPARQRAVLILRDVLGFSALVSMLAQDARIAMPPRPTWYSGREQVAAFVRRYLLTERTRWRLVPTSANGQLAAAAYLWVEQAGAFMPDCLHVLTLRGGEIEEIMAFRSPEVFPSFDLPASIAA